MPFSVILPSAFTRYRPATGVPLELDEEELLELELELELLELELELPELELLELEEELLNPEEDEEELLEEDDEELPEELLEPPHAVKLKANRQELANVTGLRQSANAFIEDIFTYLLLVNTHLFNESEFNFCITPTLHPETNTFVLCTSGYGRIQPISEQQHRHCGNHLFTA